MPMHPEGQDEARMALADYIERATTEWPAGTVLHIGLTAEKWRILIAALRGEPVRAAEARAAAAERESARLRESIASGAIGPLYLMGRKALLATKDAADDLAKACVEEGDDKAAGALQFISGFIADRLAELGAPPSEATGDPGTHLLRLIQYAEWQINEGHPFHPTLPSAVSAARAALLAAPSPAEPEPRPDRWDPTGAGTAVPYGPSTQEWFRRSDGALKSFPGGFDPNVGGYVASAPSPREATMPRLDPQYLSDLIARVGALAGAAPEIDAEITGLFYERQERFIGEESNDGPGGTWMRVATPVWVDPRTDRWVSSHAFDFTANPARAGLLISRLPGGWQTSTKSPDPTQPGHAGRAWAKIQPFQANVEGWEIGPRDATGASVALALTCAALMALAEQAEREAVRPREAIAGA